MADERLRACGTAMRHYDAIGDPKVSAATLKAVVLEA
jgi:hypothetical protein